MIEIQPFLPSETSEEKLESLLEKKFNIPINVEPIALKKLNKYFTKDIGDSTYGFKNDRNEYYLGKTKVDFKGDNIKICEKTYTGTPGLCNLFITKEPDKGLATEEDKCNYVEELVKTDKLFTVKKAGHVTIHSTASKKYIDVIKPMTIENPRLKASLEKKEIKEGLKQKEWNKKAKKNFKK